MKLRELIKELQGMDPDAEIILQIDPEGNGFNELSGSEAGFWLSEDQKFLEELDSEMMEDLEERGGRPIKAVVFYP